MKFHEPSVKKEIEMAQITPSDRILQIGCGAIPYSLIIISKMTQKELTGIDNQGRSIQLAQKFLQKYKHIHVEQYAGETYDVSDYDVILISYGVGNIDAVLYNVLKNLKNTAKILFRKPVTVKSTYIDSIIKQYSKKKIRLLLTQESILLMKQ
ncbi:MAG: methyltransferase domain-containing protein [Candidatus Thermoplasmatota archaeon]|nr:methyltransferase domain-containing protein [Candidatus Thermoplasmatota archaeon]